MTNKTNVALNADGPPQKRRRTHPRKSPKAANQPNTLIVPLIEQPTISSSPSTTMTATPNPRREKKPKSTYKKEVDLHRKRGEPTTDRCSDYLSDKWKPDFCSTYPLAKSLERRRVLVDYIHLVKRINARKDKVELPPKRLSVLPPQTVGELEKEIDKCASELNNISRQRDETLELRTALRAKYKVLYREEEEERRKLLQIQEEKRIAELTQSSELEKLLLTMAAAQGVIPGDFMQSLAAMATQSNQPQTNQTHSNQILQAQQQLLAAASSIPGVDIAQYFNTLSQMGLNPNSLTPQHQQQSGHSSADIRNQSAQKHQMTSSSPAVTTSNRTSQHQSQANLMNPTNSNTLNMFHAMSSTQNPFALSNQPNAGLLTQQSQGGLVASQPQNLMQQQNQQNPFLTASSQQASQQNQQSRPQSAFPPLSQSNQASQQKQQLEFQMQNMINQWSANQNLSSLTSLNANPQAKSMLANLQQAQQAEQQRQISAQQAQQLSSLQAQQANQQAQQKQLEMNQTQSQNAIYQTIHQSILARNQQSMHGQQQQKQLQGQNLLSAGMINTGSRQSPLATSSYASQQQMGRKSGVGAQQQSNQQAQLQNRLQLPSHLTGRSATPQFAVPTLPTSSQPKAPPRAQSTRPPMSFAVSSVISSTSNAQPSQSVAMPQQLQNQQPLQAMFQLDNSQQEALLNQLSSSLGGSLGNSMSAEQQQLMLQMLLMTQHQQSQQMPK